MHFGGGVIKKHYPNFYSVFVIRFIASPAIISPATDGTNDMLAGTGLPVLRVSSEEALCGSSFE